MTSRLSFSAVFVVVYVLLSGCSDGSDSGPRNTQDLESVLDFESYTWEEVSSGAQWDPRAGLQTVELNGLFYLLGGSFT